MTGPVSIKRGNWTYVEVTKDRVLGQGSYGIVCECQRRAYKGRSRSWAAGPIAVKFPKKPLSDEESRRNFLQEIGVMSEIEHPACLNLFAWTWDAANGLYGIATDIMPTSLDKILSLDKKGQAPPEWTSTRRCCVAFGIAAGMSYLHSKNIVHRDLKPANVLLDEQLLPHVADFGLSKLVTVANQMEMTCGVGTPIYMAPELYDEAGYTAKVDVYAYGIMLFELFTAQEPFEKVKNRWALKKAIERGDRPKCPSYLPAEVVQMMEACWNQSPADRPSFADILEHPEGLLLSDADEVAFEDFRRDLLEERKMDLPL
jgi:serine/threonine protein kinase